jgi:hypothetical protein
VNVVTDNSLSRGDGTPHSCQPNQLGAEASRCGSRLAQIGSHSWASGRLIPMVTLTLSVVDGHVDTVDSCNWDGHDGAVRLIVANGHTDAVGYGSVVDDRWSC